MIQTFSLHGLVMGGSASAIMAMAVTLPARSAELPKSTQAILKQLKLDPSILGNVGQPLGHGND